MKRAACLFACLALLPTTPALAWTISDDDEFYAISQLDGSGRFALTVDCDAWFGFYAITIQGQEAWDSTASYAPEVPTSIKIDGVALPETAFVFMDIGGYVAVVLEEDDAGFDEIYAALHAATGTAAVTYFDKAMTFDVSGAGAALDDLEYRCWG